MSDELREIAQQIIDGENGSACWWDSDGPESGPAYAVKLAKAYIAEHPADDVVSVTPEWLESIGLSDSLAMRLERRYELCPGVRVIVVAAQYGKWVSEIWVGGGKCYVKKDPTRGDVRRLIEVLGIRMNGPGT